MTAFLNCIRSQISPVRCLLSAMCLAVLLTGCSDRTPIREYVVEREVDQVLTSAVVRREFPGIPLKWNVPKSWRVAENDQFSRMAWEAGPRGRAARITVSDLPMAAGIQPQVARWRVQLQMPEVAQDQLMSGTEQLSSGAATSTWVELTGAEESILGLIVPVDDKLWIVKFRSSNTTVKEEKQTFRGFCESISVPESRRS